MFAYCNNCPIKNIDCSGNKAWDYFETIEEAAEDFGRTYNEESINSKQEYGAIIFMIEDRHLEKENISIFGLFSIPFYYVVVEYYYTYAEPTVGRSGDSVIPNPIPALLLGFPVSSVHTHANYDPRYKNEEFSPDDKKWSRFFYMDSYLVTPGGTLQRYNVDTDDIDVICLDMPRDPNMP